MTDTVLLCGATGRMGKAIASYLYEDQKELLLKAQYSKKIEEQLLNFLKENALVIDFSLPALTQDLLEIMIEHKIQKPLVIGTTGLTSMHHEMIDVLSKTMPILQETNMSPGIHYLNHVIQQAPEFFDDAYDIDLYDRHHRNKIDSPSGTLLTLMSTLEKSYGLTDAGYTPDHSKRPEKKIGISVERTGHVFGEHRVSFASDAEEIQLIHRAFNRKLFAKGAVLALNWLKNKPAGRYSMADVFK